MPEHWGVLPGRACFREKKIPNTGLKESAVLSLSYGQIVVKPSEKLHGLVPASFETYQIVDPGDIICRPTDLQNDWNSLRFGFSRNRGIITSAYMCFHAKKAMTREYGHLLLHTYDLKKIFYGLGSGLRQNLDWQDFKYLPCLTPPLPEQSAIVRYLNHADQRIRRYIRTKQKLIALLNEQKQAIIHHAVTRGLDPNVRLKPSGVEWLGDVPEHWEVRRAKHLFREVDHRSATGTEVLLSLRMYQGLVPHNEVSTIPISAQALVGFKKVEPGQIVMNRMRAAIGMFGAANQPGLVSPDYAVLEPIANVEPMYFLRLFRTPAAGTVFRIESKGLGTGSSGFMRLYTERFGIIKLPVPPQDEQRRIVRDIAATTQEIERTEERVNREVALLREYRTRLIADVVTGKLDVRQAAAKLPDEPEELEPLAEAETLADGDEEGEGVDLGTVPEEAEV